MPTTTLLPMPVLLSRTLGHLESRLSEDAGVGPAVPSLAVWSNVVRCVAEAGVEGLDERDLSEAARISRRMATAAVTGAARRGWVTARADGDSGKHRRVELSDVGRAAAETWPECLATIDATWGQSPLRAVLDELVGRLRFELPHWPASYGAADPSAIGGPFVQQSGKNDGLPAHGKDWKPVMRGEIDTVSTLPLTALMSQTLMAFTIDYEDRFPWPLASTSTVLYLIGPEPRPLADLPGGHGITGAGKSMLERHMIVEVTRGGDDGQKLVALTDRGSAVMHHHPLRLEAVETEWQQRFGDDLVAGLRTELTPIAEVAQDQPDHAMAPLQDG